MEIRDQVTQDQVAELQRPWNSIPEVQQGSLLVDLAASLRRRLMYVQIEQPLAKTYRVLADAARETGNALIRKARVPFVPDPPFSWSRVPLAEVNRKVPEIEAWAAAQVLDDHQPKYVRHAALDLRDAGLELSHHLERQRSR